jgi:type IV secretory pathway protease TraF
MTRFGRISATCVAALGVALSTLPRPAPRLIWNVSASVPIGLYAVRPAGALHVNELLVVIPPEPLATFLDERYLPRGVPLLKHVLALLGRTVCRSDRTITVDGVAVGETLDRDHLSRPLPVWHGGRVIAGGDVFLMNRQSVDSLYGRYLGPLPTTTTTVVGRADPLRTDQEHRPCRNPASGEPPRSNHLRSTPPPSGSNRLPLAAWRCLDAGAARVSSFGSALCRYCWSTAALFMPSLSPPTAHRRHGSRSNRRRRRRSVAALRHSGVVDTRRHAG